MNDDDRILESMGKQVADALGTGPEESRRLAQREAAALIPAPRRRVAPSRAIAAAAAAAVLIAAAVSLFIAKRERPAQLWIGKSVTVNKNGVWIQASLETPVRVSFKDGSRVVMEQSAGGQILEASTKEVRIVLGKGKISAKVRPGTKTKWTVLAGPYSVMASGTQFTVFWNEESTVFEVAVVEGKVLVKGIGLDEEGMIVAAGSRLYINTKESVISLGPIEKPESPAASLIAPPGSSGPSQQAGSEAAPVGLELQAAGGPAAGSGQAAPAPASGSAVSPWKRLADEGRYTEALEAAEKDGLDGLLQTASLADLWQLADTARYAGDAGKAWKTLLAIRSRFGKSKRARIAAFLLGRVAIDLKKKPGEGAQWFETYLKEDPGGPLAEEALGRLMDAYLKTGSIEKAQGAAKTYLKKYADGAFAGLARTTLGGQ
jgi:transmembrane sensor